MLIFVPKHLEFIYMSEPLVSVIMPSFNHGRYIKDAIVSVINQTYQNFELIIVDNYSTDDTDHSIETCQDKRIFYHKFNNRGNIAASRNFAVSKAKGTLLAFLDSDDIWLPPKLTLQIQIMADDTIACTGSTFIPIGDIQYSRLHPLTKQQLSKTYTYHDMLLNNPIITSSAMIKTADFERIQGFDEDPRLFAIEDWDLWLRLCQQKKAYVHAKPLVQYRIINNKRDMRTISMNMLTVLDKHISQGFLPRKIIKTARGNCYVSIAKSFLNKDDKRGMYFCLLSIYYAQWSGKLKASVLMVLFLIPRKIKHIITKLYYRYRQKI